MSKMFLGYSSSDHLNSHLKLSCTITTAQRSTILVLSLIEVHPRNS